MTKADSIGKKNVVAITHHDSDLNPIKRSSPVHTENGLKVQPYVLRLMAQWAVRVVTLPAGSDVGITDDFDPEGLCDAPTCAFKVCRPAFKVRATKPMDDFPTATVSGSRCGGAIRLPG
jgi:hypothetical protein